LPKAGEELTMMMVGDDGADGQGDDGQCGECADAVAGSAKIAAANNAERLLVIFMTANSLQTR